MPYNKTLYNLARAKARVARKKDPREIKNVKTRYAMERDLLEQKSLKLKHLIQKAKNSKNPNWSRIDKLASEQEESVKMARELNKLLKGLD
jgi:hypothetical protein